MPERAEHQPTEIAYYEGLIRRTAGLYARYVEEDYEDICQLLRIKVWKALEAFNEGRSNMPVQRFVFMCLKNQGKDLLGKARRDWIFIDSMVPANRNGHPAGGSPAEDHSARDRFEHRYLSESADEVFAAVEEVMPVIPSTLDERERQVVALLYLDYSQVEAARMLKLTPGQVERAVKRIRKKMDDWRPSMGEVVPIPLPADEPSAQAA